MKFLIIEDNNFDQFKIQFYLEQLGYNNISFAENIFDADLKIRTSMPNIIITNLIVNQENILNLFSKKNLQKITTIVFTEEQYGNFVKEITLLKNFVLLPKPINRACLEIAIHNLLKKG